MCKGIVALLPLFMEKADTPVMKKHDMNPLRNVTGKGNVALLPLLMGKADTPVMKKHDMNPLRNVTGKPGQFPF